MASSGEELEVKFYVPDLARVAERLQALSAALGAKLVQPRQHETNLRFDTPNGDLVRQRQVLRLRQDDAARLTFKGPGREVDGIQQRQELEFTVSNFGMAQRFLEALGYQVIWMYEKYRQTYALGDVLVTLDELPFGNFIEVKVRMEPASRRRRRHWGWIGNSAFWYPTPRCSSRRARRWGSPSAI